MAKSRRRTGKGKAGGKGRATAKGGGAAAAGTARSGRNSDRWADHYTREARDAGYAARSVFKLQEIDRRFSLFRGGMNVLDLGAAPGSWSQYVVSRIGPTGRIVAVDLQPIGVNLPGNRTVVLQGDFTDTATVSDLSARGPYDAVISDAAPATTGNRTIDTARSAALADSIIEHLSKWLIPGGGFVCKLFQGGDEQALLGDMRAAFASARLFRPPAVRKASFETYLVGTGFRG